MGNEANRSELSLLLKDLFPVVRDAGSAIMKIYDAGFQPDQKSDGSPVTQADEAAEEIILEALAKIAPEIPVISEENAASHKMKPAKRFFLVDPLDGTREFVKRDGQGAFTVNIALIEDGAPVLGVVFAPALERLFAGVVGEGAVESHNKGSGIIEVRPVPDSGPLAVASVSHRDQKTNQWLLENHLTNLKSIGSSLKFCLIACGEADIYPRFSPTMEWDTAAGDAILRAAGGAMVHEDGRPFSYGKQDYRNGSFFAFGTWKPDLLK